MTNPMTRDQIDRLRALAEQARNTMEVAHHTYARGGQTPAWEAAAKKARHARQDLHAALTDGVVLSLLDALDASRRDRSEQDPEQDPLREVAGLTRGMPDPAWLVAHAGELADALAQHPRHTAPEDTRP